MTVDKTITDHAFLSLLREACDNAGSIQAWSERHGLSFSYVAEVLRGQKKPGEKILAAMGYERVTGVRKRKEAP